MSWAGDILNEVFESIITDAATQEERGVGLQNFKCPPAWEEMHQILRDISTQVYESLSKHIQMPAGRNLRMKRARVGEPRFPMEINDTATDNVAELSAVLGWRGQDSLSEGRLRVADPRPGAGSLIRPKFDQGDQAALRISDALDHEDLFKLLKRALDGLIDQGIRVVSYASDGTEVGRKVQKQLLRLGTPADRVIKNPFPNRPYTRFHFTIYRSQDICVIQGSKHALKPLRKNLFTGARLLTFGNSAAAYHLVNSLGSPLPKRDVEKVDRQDDNASCPASYSQLQGASREALDILDILIQGQLALVFIHRDYVDGIAPLVPWLNWTEPCYHVFASTRRVVKEFPTLSPLRPFPRIRRPIYPTWYTLTDADQVPRPSKTRIPNMNRASTEGGAILAQNIQNLATKDAESPQGFRTEATNKKMEQLAIADLAVATNDAMRCAFIETGDEELNEIVAGNINIDEQRFEGGKGVGSSVERELRWRKAARVFGESLDEASATRPSRTRCPPGSAHEASFSLVDTKEDRSPAHQPIMLRVSVFALKFHSEDWKPPTLTCIHS
ncbi:hypothetical protein DFP72DRAFT_1113720 [Ephemerocybe angulata]|uniref:Uncharacterized protein n=1 Tax=Ephemerocybe angulata TaxID=980116 RepID=A0A8H6H7Y4_9AGAR|nr:hypothetical protein DFP72DRAFT_1113720 [Tulosesus angulatus]